MDESPSFFERITAMAFLHFAQKKVDAEKGWIIYNRLMDVIDNELQDRGLSSTQQKGAEDLNLINSQKQDLRNVVFSEELVWPDEHIQRNNNIQLVS